jgi:hypothetical protein
MREQVLRMVTGSAGDERTGSTVRMVAGGTGDRRTDSKDGRWQHRTRENRQ